MTHRIATITVRYAATLRKIKYISKNVCRDNRHR